MTEHVGDSLLSRSFKILMIDTAGKNTLKLVERPSLRVLSFKTAKIKLGKGKRHGVFDLFS